MASVILGGIGAWLGTSAAVGMGATAATAATAASFGAVAGAAIGAAAGMAVGAYIDQTYIYPMFQQGPGDIRGPRVDDFPLQLGSEGSPIHYILGAENRVAGVVIWLSPIIEDKEERNIEGGKGGGGGAKQTTYTYYYHVAIAVCEGVVTAIDKIWADGKIVYDSSADPTYGPRTHRIRFYYGTEDQTPDTLIQGYEGVNNTPAYRGTCYVVIEGLFLRDFGNRLPQFTFQVRRQDHESVSAAIYNLLNRQGLADEEINVSNVAKSVRGYVLTGPTPATIAIDPLMQVFDVLSQESNGVLTFFTRGYEQEVLIDEDDLSAHSGTTDSQTPRPFKLTDNSGFALPSRVNIKYIDPTMDYQSGSQHAVRNYGDTTHVISMDAPVVLDPRDAANIAATQLWRRHAESMAVEFFLPPEYYRLQENDIAVIPALGNYYRVRLVDVTCGDNFLLHCRGVLVGVESANENAECGKGNTVPPLQLSKPLTMSVLDVPAVTDEDQEVPGVYIAAASDPYQGNPSAAATVYVSANGEDYVSMEGTSTRAAVGIVLEETYPLDAEIPTLTMDSVSEITVLMLNGEPTSVSEDQLLAGANRIWIGKELVAYQTAELLSDRVYKLTNLLRGLRMTTPVRHSEHEKTAIASSLSQYKLGLMSSGSLRYIKLLQFGQLLEDVEPVAINFRGNNARQAPPCQLDYTRHDPGDIEVTWCRRTRSVVPLFSENKPMGHHEERYTVEVWSEDGETMYREFEVTSPSASYSKTDQDTDTGSGSVANFYFRIWQHGTPILRGAAAEIFVSDYQ
jgi:hypothetical protein